MNYSVLMSVYAKETPAYLQSAIESMLNQTVPPSQFVLMCDGPLTAELDAVVERYSDKLDVVRLPENKGLGEALNIGLSHCTNELIARMDSDDISLPDRCEKELAVFEKDSGLTILSGYMDEFSQDPDKPFSRRVVPLTHDDIIKYSKRRNPFNHVTVMFKKQAILDAGSYTNEFLLFEDYDLWVRVLARGAKVANIPQTLVKVRAPADQLRRRGGLDYGKQELRFRKKLLKSGWISRWQYITTAYPHFLICILPNFVRVQVYKILRK